MKSMSNFFYAVDGLVTALRATPVRSVLILQNAGNVSGLRILDAERREEAEKPRLISVVLKQSVSIEISCRQITCDMS